MAKNFLYKGLLTSIAVAGFALNPILAKECKKYTTYQIATGSTSGTYYKIGSDLAKYVAPEACINLEVIPTKGSVDNVYMLRDRKYPKVKFAIVQNDVLQELEKNAKNGDKRARDLVRNLRVIKPLYNEEIHIISRADSNINNFADLKGKRLSIGPMGSGTAMTSVLMYQELFGNEPKHTRFESFDNGLSSLSDGKVDAVIKVIGQPFKRLANLSQNVSQFIKLVEYDENSNRHNPAKSYYIATIKKDSYKWIDRDIKTLSTKSYLITFNYKKEDKARIKEFIKALNKKLNYLK